MRATVPDDQVGNGDPAEWLAHNTALRIDDDLAMFDHISANVVRGHICFTSRGRKALTRAEAMLQHMFSTGIERIIGEVPAWRIDVLRFVGKLGFQQIGFALREVGSVVVLERKSR